MKKILFFLLFALSFHFAQAQKPDFVRTPNGPNTIVDWNLKARTLIVPHGDSVGIFWGSQDTTGQVFFRVHPGDTAFYFRVGGKKWIRGVSTGDLGNTYVPYTNWLSDVNAGNHILTLNGIVTTGLTAQHINFNGTYFSTAGYGQQAIIQGTGAATANGDTLTAFMFKPQFVPGPYAVTVNTIVGGSGYVPGFYPGVQLNNTSVLTGVSPTADITVNGSGQVTTVVIDNGGTRNSTGNNLVLLNPAALGGSGSGFSCKVNTTANYTGVADYAGRSWGNWQFNGLPSGIPTTGNYLALDANRNLIKVPGPTSLLDSANNWTQPNIYNALTTFNSNIQVNGLPTGDLFNANAPNSDMVVTGAGGGGVHLTQPYRAQIANVSLGHNAGDYTEVFTLTNYDANHLNPHVTFLLTDVLSGVWIGSEKFEFVIDNNLVSSSWQRVLPVWRETTSSEFAVDIKSVSGVYHIRVRRLVAQSGSSGFDGWIQNTPLYALAFVTGTTGNDVSTIATYLGSPGITSYNNTAIASQLSVINATQPQILLNNNGIVPQSWGLYGSTSSSTGFKIYNATGNYTGMYITADGEVRFGSNTNISANGSKAYFFGGLNGANIDAQGDASLQDQATFEAEGADYQTTAKSLAIRYYGTSAPGFLTFLGIPATDLGVLDFGTSGTSIIRNSSSASILLGINNTQVGSIDATGLTTIGRHAITGTGGKGFVSMLTQSISPATPASGTHNIYFDSSGRLAFVGSNGWVAAFSRSLLTASQVYNLPNNSGVLALASDGPVTLSSRSSMGSYAGTSTVVEIPGDGIFDYVSGSSATADGGTVFAATGKGSGRWIRNYPAGQIQAVWYGIVADSTVDNTTKMRAMNSAVATNGATIYMPNGSVLMSGTDTVKYPCKFVGNGALHTWWGSEASGNYWYGNTNVIMTVGNVDCFYIPTTTHGADFFGMGIFCTAVTPSAGFGVHYQIGNGIRFENNYVGGFYTNFRLEDGMLYKVERNQFSDPQKYNVWIGNTSTFYHDNGEGHFNNNSVTSALSSTAIQLFIQSGGGLHVSGNYFYAIPHMGTLVNPAIDIDAQIFDGTSSMWFDDNRIESWTSTGVRVRSAPTFHLNNVHIGNNMFTTPGGSSTAIVLSASGGAMSNVIVNGNILQANHGLLADTVTNLSVYGNQTPNYTNGSGDTYVGVTFSQNYSPNSLYQRITKRVLAYSSNAATYTVNTDLVDVVHITGQTATITGFTLTGTPVDGDILRFSITGTASVPFTLTGTYFENSGSLTLPTTTNSTTRLDFGFVYNTETSKWRLAYVF